MLLSGSQYHFVHVKDFSCPIPDIDSQYQIHSYTHPQLYRHTPVVFMSLSTVLNDSCIDPTF
jgi:hypothetical protein